MNIAYYIYSRILQDAMNEKYAEYYIKYLTILNNLIFYAIFYPILMAKNYFWKILEKMNFTININFYQIKKNFI